MPRSSERPDDLLLVQASTYSEETYQRLKKAIVTGYLGPGQRLVERDLVDRMGVSRTPVREAIQRLTYDGLVVGEPYRGVFVRELSHKEAQDLYELRAALEGTAALLASSRATTADIAGLEALLEEIRMARQKGDWPNSLLGNHAFHRRIGQTSANEAIMNQLDTVLSQISLWRTAYMHTGGTYRDTFPEHAAIMEALARREGSTARVLMEEHIMRSWRNSTGSSER